MKWVGTSKNLLSRETYKMIAPLNINEYNKLKKEYLKLSSFIRSLYNHTEMEDKCDYGILKSEMASLSKRLDKITTEMDAFEQNDLVL